MKKLLLFNLVLTGIVSILFLTSGANVETFEIKYTHHFERNLWGDMVVILEKYREHDTDMMSYTVCTCASGLVFNCLKNECTYPGAEGSCGCGL